MAVGEIEEKGKNKSAGVVMGARNMCHCVCVCVCVRLCMCMCV